MMSRYTVLNIICKTQIKFDDYIRIKFFKLIKFHLGSW